MLYKIAFVLLGFSSSCYSDALRVGAGIGQGNVELSSEFKGTGNYAGDDPIATSLYFGYIFDNKYVVDLSYGSSTDDLVFGANDNVHFDTYEILLGYRISFDNFYLEPQLGYAKWELELEEGALLNPGPEYKLEDDGSDAVYSLRAGYKFSPLFGMSVSYKYIDFEHGNGDSLLLGFDFEF